MDETPVPLRAIKAPIAIGELIDKISILEIKAERIGDQAKLSHVQAELKILNDVKAAAGLDTPEMRRFAEDLKSINLELWDIENELRKHEARKAFDEQFVMLARKVYLTNERRVQVKRTINLTFGSQIIEEKSYGGA